MNTLNRTAYKTAQECEINVLNLVDIIENEYVQDQLGTTFNLAIVILDSDDEFQGSINDENDDSTYSAVIASEDDDSMSQDSQDSIETIDVLFATTQGVTAPANEEFPVFPGGYESETSEDIFADLDSLAYDGGTDIDYPSDLEMNQEEHDHQIYHHDLQEMIEYWLASAEACDPNNCSKCFQDGNDVEAEIYCRHCPWGYCFNCATQRTPYFHCKHCGQYLH